MSQELMAEADQGSDYGGDNGIKSRRRCNRRRDNLAGPVKARLSYDVSADKPSGGSESIAFVDDRVGRPDGRPRCVKDNTAEIERRDAIWSRAGRAYDDLLQTFLSEFDGDVDLYGTNLPVVYWWPEAVLG